MHQPLDHISFLAITNSLTKRYEIEKEAIRRIERYKQHRVKKQRGYDSIDLDYDDESGQDFISTTYYKNHLKIKKTRLS